MAGITKLETQFYNWKDYRCAYEIAKQSSDSEDIPLVLIHPIGVGLSRQFWRRFCQEWLQKGYKNPIYNPDLLGCGESDMPRVAYRPADWAKQLQHFCQTVVQKPAIVVVQGALLAAAIKLTQLQEESNLIRALVLSDPPAWPVMTGESSPWQQKLVWNLFFDAPAGNGFYRYARRREFLASFSRRQLFAAIEDVDAEWLETLMEGSDNMASRYAVFSFLAGFWRKNYDRDIAAISQPTLVVVGDKASSISRQGKQQTPEMRLADYLKHLPRGQGVTIPGRNVLPYESVAEFVAAIAPFILSSEF